MWTDWIKNEWERLTNAKNCICNVFVFPSPFLILSRVLLFHLTAVSSSAKDSFCILVWPSILQGAKQPQCGCLNPPPSPNTQRSIYAKPYKAFQMSCKWDKDRRKWDLFSDFKSPFKFYTMWVNWGSHQQALGNEIFAFVYQLDFNSGALSQLLFNVWLGDCWRQMCLKSVLRDSDFLWSLVARLQLNLSLFKQMILFLIRVG